VLVRERHEPAGRRRLDGVLTPRVLWINPSGTDFGGTSVELFVQTLGDRVHVELVGLQVWRTSPGHAYGMATEVDAVTATAAGGPVHLFGFSAGGTVALAAALALGNAVCSVTVLEPAFIGDDDWDPVETEWRSRQRDITALPPDQRIGPFRQLLMRPGLDPPPPRETFVWGFHDDLLEGMLGAETGFVSADLAAIRTPVLAIRGGHSHPRWAAVSRRLADVCPDFRESVFPELHHFSPPFREEPELLAALLLALWASA
jgi:pimeloyl-ACP methyl ester carboxylesterase